MYNIKIVCLALFCFSCSKESAPQADLIWTLESDTVIIKGGDEILYLEGNLHTSALSTDEKFLYNFNHYDHTLEKIDLESLVLVDKIKFEQEGPNGTGRQIYDLRMIDESSINLSSYFNSNIFSLEGKVLKRFNLYNHGWDKPLLNDNEQFRDNMLIPGHNDQLFTIVFNMEDNSFEARKINLSDQVISIYNIDPERKLPRFSFKVPSISSDPMLGPALFLSTANGNIIISSNITNELYLYDPNKDLFSEIKSQNTLTKTEKQGIYSGTYGSVEELIGDYIKTVEEINFSPPIWDKSNELYYRFSFIIKYSDDKDEEELLPSRLYTDTFLTIYDKDFNMVGEMPVPQLINNPNTYFVKDGKIWIYENMDDELAFIRLDFKVN